MMLWNLLTVLKSRWCSEVQEYDNSRSCYM